jgi:hypothetical protein
MNIPDKVKIGGFDYSVVRRQRVNKGDIDVVGEIFYDQCEIAIRSGIEEAPDYADMVFLHECVHGIMYAVGLEQSDEIFVERFSKGLQMFIKDNPKMFA